MSDNKSKRPDDEFVDFGDFDAPSPPPPPSADQDFPFEDLPQPPSARSASGTKGGFNDFEDLAGGKADDDDDPFGAADAPAAERPKDDFGYDEEPVAARPVAAASRRAEPSFDEPSFDDEGSRDPDDDGQGFDDREFSGEGDDVSVDEDREDEDEGAAPAQDRKHQLIRYAVLAGMCIAGLGVTWLGYSTVVKPMLFGDSPAQVASGPMVPSGNRGPQAQPTGSLPPMGGPQAQPAPSQPRLPTATLPPAVPNQPAPIPAPSQPAPVPTPAAVQPAPSPVATPVRTAADPALTERVSRVESQVQGLPSRADLEQRIKQLEDRLARVENRAAPAAPRPEVQVPMKPQVLDGWTLQGVNRDTAWLKGPNGIMEVREDTDLGGNAGKVTRIQRYQNSWIVVTTTGVIMRN